MIVGKAPCCGADVRLDMERPRQTPMLAEPDAVLCDECGETYFLWRGVVYPGALTGEAVLKFADVDADARKLILRDENGLYDAVQTEAASMAYEDDVEAEDSGLMEPDDVREAIAAPAPQITDYLRDHVRLRCAELAAPWSRRHGGSLDFFFIRSDAFSDWVGGRSDRLRVLEIAVAAGIETEAHEATLDRANKIWAWVEGE